MTDQEMRTQRPQGLPQAMYLLNTDGGIVAAPNQPQGEAAIGAILTSPEGEVIAEASARLGWSQDHHVAEFNALILGLSIAHQLGIGQIQVRTDSELVHHTMKGTWRLRPPHLQALRDQAKEQTKAFASMEIDLIPREQNAAADKLAGKFLGRLRPKPPVSPDLIL